MCFISRTFGSWGFSREAWAGLAEATWLLAPRARIGRPPGTITIPYKLFIYTGQFWAPAAPGALWAAPAGLAWVVLPGCLAGWSGWLIGLIWLAGWVGWLLWLLAPRTGCWRVACSASLSLGCLADLWRVLSSIRGRGQKWYASLGEVQSAWVSRVSCSQVGQMFSNLLFVCCVLDVSR